ncbi:NAD-dependent succinate-semialdehyde dehydrogenase [Cryobacterium sp. Y11]|uniref:NAD-dependent succinate-semialdehyde dehydrogenase n=1 Tax=Cryobacterium sp. Y11 TaxID=2045016 RepID=UPI000CE39004|nr:NAD-dependent succinate-semialdehyde dehydrogenase [Cryobacterium sp. Y11]
MTILIEPTATRVIHVRGHELPTGNFIGGQWIDLDETFQVTNPATGAIIGEVSNATGEHALAALDAANAAQAEWGGMDPRARARLLRGALDLMRDRARQFSDTMTAESGKPTGEAMSEFALSAGFFEWVTEQIAHVNGTYGVGSNPGYRVITSHHPIGPSLLVTPWNFPMLMGARKISAALAAGCTVIVKSAQQTPLTLTLLVKTLDDAGIPAGVVNLLHTTKSSGISSPLLNDRRLKKLSFTGSTGVGSRLLELAAKNVVNSSMELGGNAAFIVADDADIDLAVREAITCKFRNAGQACVAANRFILHSAIAEEFTEKFVAATKQLVVGDGYASDTFMGPLISADQRVRIHSLVQSAIADGADLLAGGTEINGPGNFYEPTVIRGVDRASRMACEELFGPVAVLHTVDSIAEAVDFANDTEFGLASYVFTRDISRAIRIGEQLHCGMVGINRGIMADPVAPFGGTGSSGLGREGGEHGIQEFLEPHYIALTIDEEAAN